MDIQAIKIGEIYENFMNSLITKDSAINLLCVWGIQKKTAMNTVDIWNRDKKRSNGRTSIFENEYVD